jgi:hypothetical protein
MAARGWVLMEAHCAKVVKLRKRKKSVFMPRNRGEKHRLAT